MHKKQLDNWRMEGSMPRSSSSFGGIPPGYMMNATSIKTVYASPRPRIVIKVHQTKSVY
jgi:hypothetical protein